MWTSRDRSVRAASEHSRDRAPGPGSRPRVASPRRTAGGRTARARPGSARATTADPDREPDAQQQARSEEHTSELQSRLHLVCRLLLEKKKKNKKQAVMHTEYKPRTE